MLFTFSSTLYIYLHYHTLLANLFTFDKMFLHHVLYVKYFMEWLMIKYCNFMRFFLTRDIAMTVIYTSGVSFHDLA